MAAAINASIKPAVPVILAVSLGFVQQPTLAAPKIAALTPLVMFVALVLAEATAIMVIAHFVLVLVVIVATINAANLVVPVLVQWSAFLMALDISVPPVLQIVMGEAAVILMAAADIAVVEKRKLVVEVNVFPVLQSVMAKNAAMMVVADRVVLVTQKQESFVLIILAKYVNQKVVMVLSVVMTVVAEAVLAEKEKFAARVSVLSVIQKQIAMARRIVLQMVVVELVVVKLVTRDKSAMSLLVVNHALVTEKNVEMMAVENLVVNVLIQKDKSVPLLREIKLIWIIDVSNVQIRAWNADIPNVADIMAHAKEGRRVLIQNVNKKRV